MTNFTHEKATYPPKESDVNIALKRLGGAALTITRLHLSVCSVIVSVSKRQPHKRLS